MVGAVSSWHGRCIGLPGGEDGGNLVNPPSLILTLTLLAQRSGASQGRHVGAPSARPGVFAGPLPAVLTSSLRASSREGSGPDLCLTQTVEMFHRSLTATIQQPKPCGIEQPPNASAGQGVRGAQGGWLSQLHDVWGPSGETGVAWCWELLELS